MLHNDKNACEFSSEIVAYMYDELALADRERFETHLPDCTSCIDEFASVSNSRYSVYEWRKIEFDPLETPVFEIPRAEPARARVKKMGWAEALAAIVATLRTPVFAAGAAVLLIALGFGAFMVVRTGKPEVAVGPTINGPLPQPVVVDTEVPAKPTAVSIQPPAPRVESPEPVKVSTSVKKGPAARPQYASNRLRATEKVPNQSRLAKKAPRLSDSADEDEETLRLADLIGEIGG